MVFSEQFRELVDCVRTEAETFAEQPHSPEQQGRGIVSSFRELGGTALLDCAFADEALISKRWKDEGGIEHSYLEFASVRVYYPVPEPEMPCYYSFSADGELIVVTHNSTGYVGDVFDLGYLRGLLY